MSAMKRVDDSTLEQIADALHAAVRAGDIDTTSRLLTSRADPNAVSSEYEGSPVEAASLEGHEEVLSLLLSHRAEPSAMDADGWTPLHNAMLLQSTSGLGIVRSLITAGAAVDVKTLSEGHTPLHLAHEADSKCDFKLVSGADDVGRTAYYLPALVQTMIAARADVNARSESGSTPLHEAAANGASSCVLALLHSGADPSTLDEQGRTPLMLAGSRWKAAGSQPETLMRLREMLSAPAPKFDAASASGAGSSAPSSSAATMAAEDVSDPESIDALQQEASWTAALEQLQLKLRGLKSSGSSCRSEDSATPPSHVQPPSRAKRTAPEPPATEVPRHKSSRGLI